jgi:hypothetical protein
MDMDYIDRDFKWSDSPFDLEVIVAVSKGDAGLLIGQVDKQKISFINVPYVPLTEVNGGNFTEESNRLKNHYKTHGLFEKEASGNAIDDIVWLLNTFGVEVKNPNVYDNQLDSFTGFFRDGFKKLVGAYKNQYLVIFHTPEYDRF